MAPDVFLFCRRVALTIAAVVGLGSFAVGHELFVAASSMHSGRSAGSVSSSMQEWQGLPEIVLGPVARNGHSYFLLESSNWRDAEAKAVSLGGHLVTIDDADEDAFVFSTFASYGGVARNLWIGLNDESSANTFVWKSGASLRHTNWALGEPNNNPFNPLGREEFVHIYPPDAPQAGRWNDVSGLEFTDTPSNGVVEIGAPTTPTAILQDPVHDTFFELPSGTKVSTFSPPNGSGSNPYATNSIAVSSDQSRALVANRSGTLQIYDLTGATPAVLRTHAESPYPADVDITPDGRFALVQNSVHTVVVELKGGTKVGTFTPPNGGGYNPYATNTIAISPDNRRAVVANSKGAVQIFDLTGATPALLRTHAESSYPADVDITPNGRFALVQHPDHTVFIGLGTGDKVATFSPPNGGGSNAYATNSIAISLDSSRALVTNAAGTIQVFDLAGANPILLSTHAESAYSADVDMTPDGRFAVVQDSAHTVFIELGGGDKIATFVPPTGGGSNPYATNTIAISTDSSRALVANTAGTLQIYDLTGPSPVLLRTHAESPYPADVDITPNGRFAIVQDSAHTVFIDLGAGDTVATFAPPSGGGSNPYLTNSIAISTDSSRALVANAAGIVQMYDLTGAAPALLRNHAESFYPADVEVLDLPSFAEIVLSGRNSPDPVNKGANITYSFEVTNNGPSEATWVTLTDQLPAAVNLVSVSATQGTCTGTDRIVCHLERVSVGTTVTVTIVAQAMDIGQVANTASVVGNESDHEAENNLATVTTTVRNNASPVSYDDSATTNEDTRVIVNVLANDDDQDGDPLTVSMVSMPSHGALTDTGYGTYTYVPQPDFNGADSFTYTATDGQAQSNLATVSIIVVPVNDAPRFVKGPDHRTLATAGPQTVPGWATGISAGPADELGQLLSFVVTTDNTSLFAAQPTIAVNGTLTYTPAQGQGGVGNIIVRLHDNGGTVAGGADASSPQVFTIVVNSNRLDPSFDADGTVTKPFPGAYAQLNDVAIQSDGKFVVAGTAGNSFVVARYQADGAPDASFGIIGSGVVTIPFDYPAGATAVALQGDGKIVAGGNAVTASGTYTFALTRLNYNGTLDTSFGGGTVTIPFGGNASLTDVAIQQDGRIVAAGTVHEGSDFALARVQEDGSLDPSFGGGGLVSDDLGGSDEQAHGLVIEPQRTIVAGGTSNRRFAIVRYSEDGARVGLTITPIATYARILDIAAQPADGGIVAVGHCWDAGNPPDVNFALARYDMSLTLDGGFGANGTLCMNIAGSNDQGRAVAVETNGNIVVAGFAGANGAEDVAVVRYTASGSLTDVTTTGFFGGSDEAYGIAIQPDGKAIAVGRAVGGSGQSEWALARYLPATSQGHDLIEVTLTDPPAMLSPGAAFTVTDTTRNRGSVYAGESKTRYYLSIDELKSGGDTRLSGNRAIPPLPAGTESTGAVTVTVPTTMLEGTYRLLACADDTRLVAEADEKNNCIVASTTMTVTLPDLVAMSLGEPPSSAAPGSTLLIADTVRNVSAVVAGASTTRYYLSVDGVKDSTDLPLTGTRSVSSLAPGATSTGSKVVVIPAGITLGTYRLFACFDDLLKVRESSETNNCLASSGTVTVAWPDLATTTVSNPPANALPGARFTVTDTVVNQGGAIAVSSTTRYYLSVDAVRDAGDKLLTGSRSIVSLAPGALSTGSRNVTVPTATASGTYHVLACADDLDKFGESDDANNCRASGTMVTIHP